MKVVAALSALLGLAAVVVGTAAVMRLIDADGWREVALAPLVFVVLVAVACWIAMYPGAILFGSIEGLVEGARLDPDEPTIEALGALTIRDVRERADQLEDRRHYERTSEIWRRLEQAMRSAGAWHVRDLGPADVARWSRLLRVLFAARASVEWCPRGLTAP